LFSQEMFDMMITEWKTRHRYCSARLEERVSG